ncbi:nascent polypeptide-associated complex protein [archaeon]|nr:nascent polypeptide-associated complex protein [archaeon]
MFPGKVNPKQMKKMMKQMGMEMEEIDVKEVIIKLEDSEIVISEPQVSVVKAMGQTTYQIIGKETVRSSISEDDIKLVAEQTNVTPEEAKKALEHSKGDLAEAIIKLQG